MKDFDELRREREQRERSFRIAGREFFFRPALPAAQYSLYLELMDKMREGRWPEGSFETLNETVLQLLEEESRDHWRVTIAENNGNPVSFEDIADVIDYCVAVQTARPTKPRSLSGSTGESGGTPSTDGSGSREEQAPTRSISALG